MTATPPSFDPAFFDPAFFDPERHLAAMAPALGLTITAAQRPGVLQFLGIAHAMAEIVKAAALEEGTFELAPVFRPGAAVGGDGR